MADPSEIIVNAEGRPVCFAGPDAVRYFQARALATALRLYAETGIRPSRRVSPGMMLAIASEFTGKRYRVRDAAQAADDVHHWAETMLSALPVRKETP